MAVVDAAGLCLSPTCHPTGRVAKAMNIQYGTVCHPFGNQHSSHIVLRLERVQNSNGTKKQLGRRTNSAVTLLKPGYNHVSLGPPA